MARDTSVMEHTAEDLIAHTLQRAGILVAKPKFDQDGADLLGLLHVKDNAKFCRIQCKGRSLRQSPTASVSVPKEYASDGLVLFLFVETGDRDANHLFCFLGSEVRNWKTAKGGKSYVLNLTVSTFKGRLLPFRFDDEKVKKIRLAIHKINVIGEFNIMNLGWAELTLPALVASGGTNPPPNVPPARGGDVA